MCVLWHNVGDLKLIFLHRKDRREDRRERTEERQISHVRVNTDYSLENVIGSDPFYYSKHEMLCYSMLYSPAMRW
jgi:hypothetical protein